MPNLDEQYCNIRSTGARLRERTYLPAALAEALCDALPQDAVVEVPNGEFTVASINSHHVPHIAELLQEVVAYTVSILIDAGSERDAVMENDTLRQALEQELSGWTEKEAVK